MKLLIANEARDQWESFEVIDLKKEGDSLAIVSPPLTIIVGPFKEFAEKVVDLYDDETQDP